jgi:uncharacterized protein (DUF486 family)
MMKHQFTIGLLLFWIFLNLSVMVTMDLALFMQTTASMRDASIIKKILTAEFWATIEWLSVIPSNRIANQFLSAAQISLFSYVFDFLGQVLSNTFWLKLPTTLDDYAAMVLIIIAMVISKYHLVG